MSPLSVLTQTTTLHQHPITLVLHAPEPSAAALFQKLKDMFKDKLRDLEIYWQEPRRLEPRSPEERDNLCRALCQILFKLVRPAIREGVVGVPPSIQELLVKLLKLSLSDSESVILFKVLFLFEELRQYFPQDLLEVYWQKISASTSDFDRSKERLSFDLCHLQSHLLFRFIENLPDELSLQYNDQIDDLLAETVPPGDTVESFKGRYTESIALRRRLDERVRALSQQHDQACHRITETAMHHLQSMSVMGKEYNKKLEGYAKEAQVLIPQLMTGQDANENMLNQAAASLAQHGVDLEAIQEQSAEEATLLALLEKTHL